LHVYAQIIDDVAGKTLAAASDMDLEVNKGKELVKIEKGGKKSVSKVEIAGKIGELIAEKAKEMKILRVVFDRGPYTYHGRVRAVAEGARKGGLSF
jgi:large subunit ribosomal protein L18